MVNHRFGVFGPVSVQIGRNAQVRPLGRIGETAKPRCHRPDLTPGATALMGGPRWVQAAKGLARSARPDLDVSGRIAQPMIAPGADLEANRHSLLMVGSQLRIRGGITASILLFVPS